MASRHLLYNSFSPWRFELGRAKDSFLWTKKGQRLIDFTSGWNVTSLGWNNQHIAQAMQDQLNKNAHAPMWISDPIQNQLAKALTDSLPPALNTVARTTGGTESNEVALKIAKAQTKRKLILGLKDTYHGQSYATLAMGRSADNSLFKAIGPLTSGVVHLNFPNTYRTDKSEEELLHSFGQELEEVLKTEQVAAVITEAGIITGWGSTYVAPKGYLKLVRDLTSKYGTFLILDEVGTGFSRTGRLFGLEHEGVVPDIVTMAKGLSNGTAAIGAAVLNKEVADNVFDKTNITSTFGWVPVSCAAALKVLEIHQKEKLWLKAEKDGHHLRQRLRDGLSDVPHFGEVRGLGMEIGVDLVKNRDTKEMLGEDLLKDVVVAAFERGLHVVCDYDCTLQLMPPLVIGQQELDEGIDILIEAIKSVKC